MKTYNRVQFTTMTQILQKLLRPFWKLHENPKIITSDEGYETET